MEDIKASLHSKKLIEKHIIWNVSEGRVESLIARGRSNEKSFNSSKHKLRLKSKHRSSTCHYCHKQGHIKTDCYKLKNNQQ